LKFENIKLFSVYKLILTFLKVKKEGLICVSNLCATCNQDQMDILVKNGCIDVIFSFLSEDMTLLGYVVNGLESILYHGRQIQMEFNYAENIYGVYLEEKRYLEKLEHLIINAATPKELSLKIEELINNYLKEFFEKI